MDFAFYRNFITVVETGSISTAAQKLDIVQPALSAQIKTLEKAYGMQLLKMHRGKRHIELTEAGQRRVGEGEVYVSLLQLLLLLLNCSVKKLIAYLWICFGEGDEILAQKIVGAHM